MKFKQISFLFISVMFILVSVFSALSITQEESDFCNQTLGLDLTITEGYLKCGSFASYVANHTNFSITNTIVNASCSVNLSSFSCVSVDEFVEWKSSLNLSYSVPDCSMDISRMQTECNNALELKSRDCQIEILSKGFALNQSPIDISSLKDELAKQIEVSLNSKNNKEESSDIIGIPPFLFYGVFGLIVLVVLVKLGIWEKLLPKSSTAIPTGRAEPLRSPNESMGLFDGISPIVNPQIKEEKNGMDINKCQSSAETGAETKRLF